MKNLTLYAQKSGLHILNNIANFSYWISAWSIASYYKWTENMPLMGAFLVISIAATIVSQVLLDFFESR